MTTPLNEYRRLTAEDLLKAAQADKTVKSWHEMTEQDKQAWLAEVNQINTRCEQLLKDLNSGKI